MTANPGTAPTPSVVDRVRRLTPGAAVTACGFLGAVPVLVLAEGELLFAGTDERRVAAHPAG
ncbi:MAG: hypothetical protein HC900_11820 [Methylacidiphilales bacterium]|nr:hypothetical protein [Candidatus Methylacidiphilales bacterium]